MRGHSILLAFASTLLSLTTADPIALAIVMPTESATPPLDRLTHSGPLDQQRSGVRATRQVISEGMGKETCGFFRTGGVTCTAGTGTSRIACHNTGRWLCGSLYSTCLGPAEPVCSGKTENGERTLCCNTESPVCGTLLRGSDARVEYVADLYHGPATTVIINIVGVFAFGYVQAPDRVCETLRYPNNRHTLGVSDEQADQDVNVRDP
ncbi:hypothetical protein CMEL01_10988 [Colletotrichum melonis]|uniref:Uncharacterized protein n=1 Tax=Colletotrichum melonis TaxID=1209925 RepID=A0AAI9UYR2_9PEZI|nr:hypothetical protein CMEL01_10988 [Colletotrichum melonis]